MLKKIQLWELNDFFRSATFQERIPIFETQELLYRGTVNSIH